MRMTRFSQFTWAVLAYNLLVILFGAYVRATGSGAGCGSHWPLCNGQMVPRAAQVETIIEYTHRITSGVSLLLVIILFILAFRGYPKGHTIRLGAAMSLAFVITEALVGAGLVLFRWVADDASTGRAISIVVHLLNTFLLLASLTLTGWWASGGQRLKVPQWKAELWILALALVSMLVLGASGALAALGDTLFPVQSLSEGIRQDFSPTAHFLIRLRILHPTIAVIVGFYLVAAAGLIAVTTRDPMLRRMSRLLTLLVLIQLAAGVVNVFLLAPVAMQILHLLLADLVWIALVLFTAGSLTRMDSPVEKVVLDNPSALAPHGEAS